MSKVSKVKVHCAITLAMCTARPGALPAHRFEGVSLRISNLNLNLELFRADRRRTAAAENDSNSNNDVTILQRRAPAEPSRSAAHSCDGWSSC